MGAPQAGQGNLQILVHLFLNGMIGHPFHASVDLSFRVAHGRYRQTNVDPPAHSRPALDLHSDDGFAAQRPLMSVAFSAAVAGNRRGATDRFRFRPAEHSLRYPVPCEHSTSAVQGYDRNGGILNERGGQAFGLESQRHGFGRPMAGPIHRQ